MKNTKLVILLKKLNARERTKCKELVDSPFFNKNKKVRALCEYIFQFAPSFEDPRLEKTQAFIYIYGGSTPYNELKINNIISDFLQLVYDYLALLQYKDQPQLRQDYLLMELLDRDLPDHAHHNAGRFFQLQEKDIAQSFEHYYHDYLYHDKMDRYAVSQARRYDKWLQEKNDALDRYYITNKLRIACDMTSRNTVVNAGYQCHFLESLLQYYDQDLLQLQSLPAAQVYVRTLTLLQRQDEALYYEWKKLLGAYTHLFPPEELRTLYNYGLNYCVRKINSGRTDFYREIFDLYRALLDHKVIFRNGYLTQWTYINIATAGIRLGEFRWTEEFIQTYSEFLLPEERANVFKFSFASLYFEKKDYLKALQMLNEVAFSDAFYQVAAKIIQLKSYFELQESEPFFSLLEATRLFLSRNRQLSNYQKQSNINFCKFAAKLYQLRLQNTMITAGAFQKGRQALLLLLEAASPVANKDWLTHQCESL